MTNIWFTSDTHFGHANIINFTAGDPPVKLRPEFASVEEMDETMIDRWNARVKPGDHIYHLGDVAMVKSALHAVLPRLSGKKRLILGNHDIYPTGLYYTYFEKLCATRVLDGIVFSHIPLHPGSVGRFKANVHGHLHNNAGCHLGLPYVNICVEHTGYAPLHFDEVRQLITKMESQS